MIKAVKWDLNAVKIEVTGIFITSEDLLLKITSEDLY